MSTTPASSERPEKLNLRPILLAVSVATVGVLPSFLTGGLAVQIRGEIGFGAGALGLAVAVFFVVSSLSSAFAGRVVERIGSHTAMRASSLVGVLSLLAVAVFAGSWWGLVACLVLGGMGNAIAQPATNLMLAREVPGGRQGLAFGVKQAAIPVATLLAGLAVPVLAVTVGWRWAFAGGALLALLISLLVPREYDGESASRVKESRAGDAPLAALILLAVGIGLGSTAATPLGAFVVESAASTGVDVGVAGLLLALGSGVGIAVRVVAGHLADGMTGGRLRLVAGMLAVGTAGFAMLASGSPGLLVVGVVLAFGAGWGWPGLFNFAIVKSNPKAPAAATGITQTGASGGAALGPLLFGYTVEATSFGTAWLAAGIVSLLAAAAILAGRRMLVRAREEPVS
ncbi:MAG: MFS transporter [Actinobacteria bacterium]|nr:MAG: MFS transporter [Actinomycetota bacterium]